MEGQLERISISCSAKKHFTFSREETQEGNKTKKFFRCDICKKEINGTKQHNLAAHIKQKHSGTYKEINVKRSKNIGQERLELLQHCTEIVTVNGRPFRALLDSGFQSIIKEKLHRFKDANMPLDLTHTGLKVVKDYIQHTASKIRDIIKNEVMNRILSLLIDIGTRNRSSFLGTNVQYIIDAKLRTRCIGIIDLEEPHTASYIARKIAARTKEYDIAIRQLVTVTTDNGSNVTKSVRDLEQLSSNYEVHANQASIVDEAESIDTSRPITNDNPIHEEIIDVDIEAATSSNQVMTDDEALALLFEDIENSNEIDSRNEIVIQNTTQELTTSNGFEFLYQITNIHCAEHTLQLAIKNAIQLLPENHQNVIELCRQVSKILRVKSVHYKLKHLVFKLPRLDVETRWCSTYLMLSDVLACEHVITYLMPEKNMKAMGLLKQKWNVLKEMVYLLKIPYEATIAMQKQSITLTDVFGKWLIMELHLVKCISKTTFKTELAQNLLNAIKTRKNVLVDNPAMLSALFLDPRYRSQILNDENKIDKAKKFLNDLYYRIQPYNENHIPDQNHSSFEFDVGFDENVDLNDFLQGNSTNGNTPDGERNSNIDLILDSFDPNFLPADTPIIDYWVSLKSSHPILHNLAIIIFAIPPTEVQVERDFSSLKNIYGEKRYGLCKSRLEDILLIHLNKDLFYEVCKHEMEKLEQ